MKNFKLLILAFVFVTFIAACGSSKNAVATKKDIKGSWTLNDISVTGLGKYDQVKIQLFDDVDISCFKGSTWELPNNNYGTYTINAAGSNCTAGARNIVWAQRMENDETIFQFKKLQEGVKAKNIEDGYKTKVIAVDNGMMTLQSQVMFEGKTLTLNYNFSKN